MPESISCNADRNNLTIVNTGIQFKQNNGKELLLVYN